jgi:cell division protein FtsL
MGKSCVSGSIFAEYPFNQRPQSSAVGRKDQKHAASDYRTALRSMVKQLRRRKKMGKKAAAVVVALFVLTLVPMATMASSTVTIVGEVNDNFQIVDSDSGQIYEIADTTEGNDLSENYIGEKAKVTGTVEQDGDVKIINVTRFEVLSD